MKIKKYILKELFSILKFNSIKTGKWLVLLFKKDRQLHKISIDYYKNWHTDNSCMVIYLTFKNAIYFKFGDTKSVNFTKPLIFNLKNFNSDKLILEVFGFRNKQVIELEIYKEIYLNLTPFKAAVDNIDPIEIIRQKTTTQINDHRLSFGKPRVVIPNISINSNHQLIKFSDFKTQEFL